MKGRVFLIAMLLFISSANLVFAQTYENPRLAAAKFNHTTMAILPVYVTEKDKTEDGRKEDKNGAVSEDEAEGYNLQRSFYEYFMTRKPKKVNWTITFQSYEETNKKIFDAGLIYSEIFQTPKDELATILGVDVIYLCEVKQTKTIANDDAMALDMILGYGGTTGNIQVVASIYEGSSSELMWTFERQFPTNYYGRTDYLVDNIMKQAVQKFPYKEKIKKKK